MSKTDQFADVPVDNSSTALKISEMIRNADLYDLINISLHSSDLKTYAAEKYSKDATNSSCQTSSRTSLQADRMSDLERLERRADMLIKQHPEIQFDPLGTVGTIFTPPSKATTKEPTPQKRNKEEKSRIYNDENDVDMLRSLNNSLSMHNAHESHNIPLKVPFQLSVLENSPIKHNYQRQESAPNKSSVPSPMAPNKDLSKEFLACEAECFPTVNYPEPSGCSFMTVQKPDPAALKQQPLKEDFASSQEFKEDQPYQTMADINPYKDISPAKIVPTSTTPTRFQPILTSIQEVVGPNYPAKDNKYKSSKSIQKSSSTGRVNRLQEVPHSHRQNQAQEEYVSPARVFEPGHYLKQTLSSQNKQRQSITREDFHNLKLQDYDSRGEPGNPDSVGQNCEQAVMGRSVSTAVLKQICDLSHQARQRDISKRGRNTNISREHSQSFCKGSQKNGSFISNGGTKNTADPLRDDTPVRALATDRSAKPTAIVSQAKRVENRKAKLLSAFAQINLGTFIEIERIKKPGKSAFQTGRMICLLVNFFRERPYNEQFTDWFVVQHFVTTPSNKFAHEVFAIKNKLLDWQSFRFKEEVISGMRQIKKAFFSNSQGSVLKQLSSNKALKSIAILVHTIVTFLLEEDMEDSEMRTFSALKDTQTIEADYTSALLSHRETIMPMDNQLATPRSFVGSGKEDTYFYHTQTPEVPPVQLHMLNFAPESSIPNSSRQSLYCLPSERRTQQSKTQISSKASVSPRPEKYQTKKSTEKRNLSNLRQPTPISKPSKLVEQLSQVNDRSGMATQRASVSPFTEHARVPSTSRNSSKSAIKFSSITAKQQSKSPFQKGLLPDSTTFVSTQKANDRESQWTSSNQHNRSTKGGIVIHSSVISQQKQMTRQDQQVNKDAKEWAAQAAVERKPASMKSYRPKASPSLAELIKEKAADIETNMKLPTPTSSRHIDMSLIEDLKKRRQSQERTSHADLELTRDRTIAFIQSQIMGLGKEGFL